MTDSYRPQLGRRIDEDRFRQSDGAHSLPPHRGPPPSMRRFGEDDRHVSSFDPVSQDFSFRPNGDAPQYPGSQARPPIQRGPRPERRGGGNRRGRGDHVGRQRYKPGQRYQRVPTADRPLLKFERGNTPDQLRGMNDHDEQYKKYVDLDDVSDSEEQSMDESESASEADTGTKRRKLVAIRPENNDVPKWSNPEVYTSLPPVDEATERKRRDVVKLIRKARVSAAKEQTQTAAADDFIGFDFGSADDDELSDAPKAHMSPKSRHELRHDVSRSDGTDDRHNVSAAITSPELKFELSVASKIKEENRKRKRPTDDVGQLQEPELKRGRGRFSGGLIVREWLVLPGVDSTPWLSYASPFAATNSGLRLHMEICDFYAFVRPRNFEQKMRADLLDRLQGFITKHFGPSCRVHAFGSFAAGLYLPNADMDLVVMSERYRLDGHKMFAQSRKTMYQLAGLLEREGIARRGSVEVVASAKVPIIKYVDLATHLHVDMSFENDSGIIANDTFLKWKAQFPAMPVLVTIIKHFLMMRGLNNNATGGLGGFAITCLVVSLLQLLPQVQLGEIVPERHLGEILLEFLDYYGTQFDLSRTAILMNPPGLIGKDLLTVPKANGPHRATRLCIIDPNRPDNDISGGTKEIMLIFRRFMEARQDILNAMNDPYSRCLLPLQGNYNDFLWHRYQLRRLYEATHGPVDEEDDESSASDIDVTATDHNLAPHRNNMATEGDAIAAQLAQELHAYLRARFPSLGR